MFNPRALIGFGFCLIGIVLAMLGFGATLAATASAKDVTLQAPSRVGSYVTTTEKLPGDFLAGVSYKNDTSAPLRELPIPPEWWKVRDQANRAIRNKLIPVAALLSPSIPAPILNIEGVPYGIGGGILPPDPDGAAGLTQYVQAVNNGIEVFDKATGASVLGPVPLATLWAGFGGVCEAGDTFRPSWPMVFYDHLANRWVIARSRTPSGVATDVCMAVSTTSDATGSYYRYGFVLGTNNFYLPQLSLWPDGYYMSAEVYNSTATAYLGPQPFAFDRAKMLNGQTAQFLRLGLLSPTVPSILPADLDGSTLPPTGAPATYAAIPASGQYTIYHFHADFVTPSNSTWTTFATPAAAPFSALCPTTSSCVPQLGTSTNLSGLGRRLMPRLAYRNFGDHESLVGNYAVDANGVAGIRWFELRNVTNGPVTVNQEGTYQPDTTWRWTGSAAMDHAGNLAIGFSASSSTAFPSIRYAGRLVNDPLNTLAQGEATLIAGGGSQTGGSQWGGYSSLTIDPVDDSTFWYTNEYYESNSSFAWRTRIGSFRFPSAPVPLSAFSRKMHGGAGFLDLPLPLTSNVGIESRNGPTYQMIINFATPVTAGGAAVTSGTGSVGGFSTSGSQITVDLTGVINAQRIALTLSNVSDGTNTGNVIIPMGVLVGDTNADAVVNAGDTLQTRNRSGQATDTANFRSDVNADGFVNSGDTVIVRAQSGAFLP